MAQLVVTSAVSIGLGLALNAIFPPDPVEQVGPRVSNLGFDASTYGRFVEISWGTDRHAGNLVDATDPPLEEVANTSTERTGKGGGQKVSQTEFQYFHTGRWSFGASGANAVLKLWFNGKLIYDVTNTSSIARPGVEFTFYPGGEDQLQDDGEVSRHGSDNAQGYRHLTSIVFNRLPLQDFGNAIQSCEALLAFESTEQTPFEYMDEPSENGVPSGGVADYMMIDRDRDTFYSLNTSGGTGLWAGNLSEFTYRTGIVPVRGGLSDTIADLAGHMYTQDGSANSEPLYQFDSDTGEELTSFGTSSIDLTDDDDTVGNGGNYGYLRATFPDFGIFDYLVHLNIFGQPNGSVWEVSAGVINRISDLSATEGFEDTDGVFIGDNGNNRGFFCVLDAAGDFDLIEMSINIELGTIGATTSIEFTNVRTFTAGSANDDFPDGGQPTGWALDRSTGNLLISNGSNMVLYNPDSDTILASRDDLGFKTRFNYYSGTVFAWTTVSSIIVIDTRDLSTTRTTTFASIGFNSGTVFHETSGVWDDDLDAVICSIPDGTRDERITRIFINRLQGAGVNVQTLFEDLCTEYQGIELGGLTSDDIDGSELASLTLPGFTINAEGPLRSWMDILRQRYFMDVIEEDWLVKARLRGGTVEETIPANRVGQKSEDRINNPPVKRNQQREEELPMRVGFRFRNDALSYETDIAEDKRVRAPQKVVSTRQDRISNLSIAEDGGEMRELARKWLWTLWNEAGSIKTRLPWEYLRFVPTDPIELTVFDEVIRTRLGNVVWGAGWFLDIDGIEEDVRDYAATLAGGANSGFNVLQISGGRDPELVFLDAPLLNTLDLNNDTHSNAYHVLRAFTDDWPGATIYRTLNGIDYEPVSTISIEGQLAKVKTAPGAWARSADDSFRNVWQETAEGGTMEIVPFRRSSEWTSATAAQVTGTGANTIAVITTNGVEVMNYQDVAVNTDDNALTLTRLLRGRLGTEDVTDAGGPSVGDYVVFLETGSIGRQNLLIANLNSSLLYKAVTIGNFLEDSANSANTYTGRDSRPYSVIKAALAAESGGKRLSWLRRSRGVDVGTLSTDPPLNETLERYNVRLKDSGGTTIETVVVDDDTDTLLTLDQMGATGDGGTAEVTQVSGTSLESPVTDDSEVDLNPTGGLFVTETHEELETTEQVTTHGFAVSSFSDLQVDDVVIAVLHFGDNANNAPGSITSTGGDFTLVDTQTAGTGIIANSKTTSMWRRTIDGTETGTWDWTWSVAHDVHITALVIRNADTAAIVDTTTAYASSASGASGTVTLPSASPTGSPHLAVIAYTITARLSSVAIAGEPADFIRSDVGRIDINTGSEYANFRYGLGIIEIPDPGATGTKVFTFTNTDAVANPATAIMALINQA